MSNIPSSLDTIPDIINTDSTLSSSSNNLSSSSNHPTDLQPQPVVDMRSILDNLKALRELIELNQSNTNRLEAQVQELGSRHRNLEDEVPLPQPETIVIDPVETEIDRLRRENSGLVSRYAAAQSTSLDCTHTRYAKVGDPPLFTGKKEDLPGFLAGLAVIFEMQSGLFRTEKQKIFHAFSFTRAPVRNALVPAITNEGIWNTTDWTRSFSAFSDYLQRNYGDPNAKVTASNKIQALRQTGSASSYFSTFMEHVSLLSDWSDTVKVSMARRGLDERILDMLVVAPNQYDDDFESFKKQVIRIDESITRNYMERSDRRRRDPFPCSISAPAGTEPSPTPRPAHNKPSPVNIRSSVSSFMPNPVRKPIPILPGDPPIDWEIENVKTSEKEKQWRRDNNRCLVCRSPDHQAAMCPSRRERTIGNDRSIRGTIVEEEKE